MTVSAGPKIFENSKLENYRCDIAKNFTLCVPLTHFIYWKLRVSIKRKEHPKKAIKKCQEFIKILTLISLKKKFMQCYKAVDFSYLQKYIYSKYIGNEGEEQGHYPRCRSTPP